MRLSDAEELLIYQLVAPGTSASRVRLVRLGDAAAADVGDSDVEVEMPLTAGHMLLIPGGPSRGVSFSWAAGGVAMSVHYGHSAI